jgi:hypothetical protein
MIGGTGQIGFLGLHRPGKEGRNRQKQKRNPQLQSHEFTSIFSARSGICNYPSFQRIRRQHGRHQHEIQALVGAVLVRLKTRLDHLCGD